MRGARALHGLDERSDGVSMDADVVVEEEDEFGILRRGANAREHAVYLLAARGGGARDDEFRVGSLGAQTTSDGRGGIGRAFHDEDVVDASTVVADELRSPVGQRLGVERPSRA